MGILTRTALHIGPNVEFVTALSIAGGYFIRNKTAAWSIPMVIMIASDMIIGNTAIYLFTWSAFAIAPVMGMALRGIGSRSGKELGIVAPTHMALGFVLFFYLWTNLGVVATSNMYTKDLGGLMHSYFNAIPFLKYQFIGNLIITPIIFTITQSIYQTDSLKGSNLFYRFRSVVAD